MKKLELTKLFRSQKSVTVALIIGIIGIVIILLSDLPIFEGEKTSDNLTTDEEYRKSLEKSVSELVENITGDENAKVYISLSNSTEYVYAKKKTSDTDLKENKENIDIYKNETSDKKEESYIIINTGNGEQPLLLSSIAPKVRGVAVIAKGANEPDVFRAITSALTVFLDISERDISVIGKN